MRYPKLEKLIEDKRVEIANAGCPRLEVSYAELATLVNLAEIAVTEAERLAGCEGPRGTVVADVDQAEIEAR